MVQVSMGMRPYEETYEVIDAVPMTQKIKKTIEVNGKWEDRLFIRIPVPNTDRLRQDDNKMEKWCREHYGNPKYLGPWFKVSGYIILDEKTFTHWKLCE